MPALTRATYVPRGSTALLDALGRTITTVRGRISGEPDSEKPWKVVFVIITDGEENASREFTRQQVFDLISEQEEKDSWEFLYLGANQDAIGEARRIGISMDRAADWKKAGALGRISAAKLRMLREMGDPIALAFDEAERRELAADDDGAVSQSAPSKRKRYN